MLSGLIGGGGGRTLGAILATLCAGVGVWVGRVGEDGGGKDSLSAGAAAGRVLDAEGSALRRPALAERWGPARQGMRLSPGDWLEVGARGANALELSTESGGELVLGPGTLLELVDEASLRLARGEVLVEPPPGAVLVVEGPDGETTAVETRAVLRARGRGLERLAEDPAWLVGYRSSASTEALGSLLANIDGRNVPLTIGYHKVTVDVRDQIARTVIEESFVNHTSSVLEGVFSFPLPADASISGFGMWIGDELVQGDIVEKERAREIYETILRERRDPGLLEWTGGNLFQARVFPIGAEKRIRLSYTQVLAREGDAYRYRYGLDSEMLRTTPLERLEIAVEISSARRIASVESPSHACRVRAGEHGARVEFSAQEYSPEGDFEVVVGLAPSPQELTVIPHRRGDDAYFMVMLDALPAEPDPSRASGEALELLVVVDTSGSMLEARAAQLAFVETLLAALGERDAFELATCDVESRYAFERFLPATHENRERALRFLEEREPLGWSDLELALGGACQLATERTQVVYVGDGVPTSGSADAVALAHELGRLYTGHGSFHAVVPASSSEPVVLRAIAALGGGSLRRIGSGGASAAAAAAFELLGELTAPAWKDLELAFEGLSVAAVHPERLPNLAAGGQQIVVGRYEPTGGEQAGRVVVTGTLGGKPRRFEREVVLPAGEAEHPAAGDADAGSSFVPRLWARAHLDHLLDQGRSPQIRERIVALSEDYQIVTPYTSFLVLESDADRERFGVRRRFRMRDGEEFFAEGRGAARDELLSEQMRVARSWRAELRQRVLEALSGMDRGLVELLRTSGWGQSDLDGNLLSMGYVGEAGASRARDFRQGQRQAEASADGSLDEVVQEGLDDGVPWGDGAETGEPADAEHGADGLEGLRERDGKDSVAEEALASSAKREAYFGPGDSLGLARSELGYAFASPAAGRLDAYGRGLAGGSSWYHDPFDALFPVPGGPRAADPEWSWPSELRAILTSLDRRVPLAASHLGWRFELRATTRHGRGRESTAASLQIIAPQAWVEVQEHVEGSIHRVEWVRADERGSLWEGWRLARTRAAEAQDAASWPAPFAWHFGDRLRAFAAYDAELLELAGGRARVRLRKPDDLRNALELSIDVERSLLLEQVWLVDGERASGERFEHPIEVGGLWWPTRITSFSGADDARGGATRVAEIAVEALPAETARSRIAGELGRLDDAIVLGSRPADLAQSKQAAEGGDAGLEERWTLLKHYAASQRWEQARGQLEAIAALEADKRGLAPLRLTFLRHERRREELHQLLAQVSRTLVEQAPDAEYGMAAQLLGFTSELEPGRETLDALDALHPIFARHPGILDAELAWVERRLHALSSLSRPEELLVERRAAAERWPHAPGLQTAYAELLARARHVDQAAAWLEQTELEHGPWNAWERAQLRQARVNVLWNGYRLAELAELLEAWAEAEPESLDASLCDRWLSALVHLDHTQRAHELTEAWFAQAAEMPRGAADQARLHAAVQHALGQGYQLYNQRLSDERAEQLARTARLLVEHDLDGYLAGWILQDWRFRGSDSGGALLAELFDTLAAGVAELPAARVEKLVGWLRSAGHEPASGQPAWAELLAGVFGRWLESGDGHERVVLARIVETHGDHDLRVRLFRQQLARASGEVERRAAMARLFAELLRSEWDGAVLDELLGLLHASRPAAAEGASEDGNAAGDARVLALHDLVDWILRARVESVLQAQADHRVLDRRALARARKEAVAQSRRLAADLLVSLERTLEPAEARTWVLLERLYLRARLGDDRAELWGLSMPLAESEVAGLVACPADREPALRQRIRAARAVATCAYLVVYAEQAALDERLSALRALLERLIEADSPFPDGRARTRDLLIALDRPDELEAALAPWLAGGQEFAALRWGIDLAHLRAERGFLAEAAERLEELDRRDELAPHDLRRLSEWYAALDRPQDARRALLRSFEVRAEHDLANELQQHAQAVRRSGDGVPPELDPNVPLMLVTLMRKATRPEHHVWVLRQLWDATQDFRLLECLSDAVIGHSAEGIYPFLHHIGPLAQSIHEEAVVDRLRARLAELRRTAATSVDARALWLLEFQVVLRAARQAHGAQGHGERALAALAASFEGEWSDGELPMYAELLAGCGRLEPEALASEQMRQLGELARLARDPDERLATALHSASSLWQHDRHDAALRTLGAALDKRRTAFGERLPESAHAALDTLTSWMGERGEWRRAETLRVAALEHALPEHRPALRLRLFELRRDALLARAELAAGSGEELYEALVVDMRTELTRREDEQHAFQVVRVLCDSWKRCHEELSMRRPRGDAMDFAFHGLPALLGLYQYRGGQGLVGEVADCLAKVAGWDEVLELLVVRAENEPRWLELANQDFWSQHAWRLGEAIQEARAAGSGLLDRALRTVLEELAADLATRHSRNRAIYSENHHRFWVRKRADFRRAALAVAEARRDAPRSLGWIAGYLWHDLSERDEATRVLAQAHARGVLAVEEREQLADYLLELGRWRECLPVAAALVDERPAEMRLRVMAMRAEYGLGESAALARRREAAEAWFRDQGSWEEGAIATLAEGCLATKLLDHALRLFDDAIALHVRDAPRRGVGDGVLSAYYRLQSQAYAELGRTREAVDAAAGAIVAWGEGRWERQLELDNLAAILERAGDLDDFARALEAEIASTGLENPILRKALAQVLSGRGEHARAAEQLAAALAAAPHDDEIHRLLVEAHDRSHRPALAAAAQLARARSSSRDLEQWKDLGERFTRLELSDQAERAHAQLVELTSQESEGHQALALVRESQGRWDRAVDAWRNVVRIRSREPQGWIELAEALIAAGRLDEARAVVDHLRRATWDPRHPDPRPRAIALERQIEAEDRAPRPAPPGSADSR